MMLLQREVEQRQLQHSKALPQLSSLIKRSSYGKDFKMKRTLLTLAGVGFALASTLTVMNFATAQQSSFPRPNRQGDFTPGNANTFLSETNGFVTWPYWLVVSSDGELNCRQAPNGRITKVYYSGRNTVRAELRGGNAFVTASNGAPWLLTRDRCYVRANNQYIRPSWQ